MPENIICTLKNEFKRKTLEHISLVNLITRKFEQIMHEQGYYEIAIYGFGSLGREFVKLLNKTDMAVKYVVDRKEGIASDEVDVRRPEQITDDIDVFIVTSEYHYEAICNELKNKVSVPIILLDHLLVEVALRPEKVGKRSKEEILAEEKQKLNVYDRRNKENLYCILPKNTYIGKTEIDTVIPNKVAVIANLYYTADAVSYLERLARVPETIDVYVVSSSEELCEMANEYIERNGYANFNIVSKENRGRDISALLVACKNITPKYEYFCFVHDKKEKVPAAKNDGDFWIENLWENTIASKEYVANIFNKFEEDPELGILAPPEPIGQYKNAWYQPAWGSSFKATKELADKLGVKCNMSPTKPPITLGTVFWCKTKALEKLLKVNWKYYDFPNEPLSDDGTLSHGIERVLAYVAQDAGYKTSMVMTDEYAAKMLSFLQVNIQKTFEFLFKTYHLKNFHDVNWMHDRMNKIPDFFANNKKVYMYGAGQIGKAALANIRNMGYEPDGFVITLDDGTKQVEGVPVFLLEQLKNIKEIGIIVTVGKRLREVIRAELENAGIQNYFFYQDSI